MDGLRLVLITPRGIEAQDLTSLAQGLRFGSAVPGGFADCSFTLDGDFRNRLDHLSTCRVTFGSSVVWEGQIEDVDLSGLRQTSVAAYGWRRILEEVTVLKNFRSVEVSPWKEPAIAYNGTIWTSMVKENFTDFFVGAFDPTNLTRKGIKTYWRGNTVPVGSGQPIDYYVPGATITRVMATITKIGLAGNLRLGWTTDGSTWTLGTDKSASGTIDESPSGNPSRLRLIEHNNSSGGEGWEIEDIRVFGTSLAEDTTSGMYGGALLNAILALVPGITAGAIEQGTDFAVAQLDGTKRGYALRLVEEVCSYYARDWAVWEQGRFDWLSQPAENDIKYSLSVAEDGIECSIDTTLDGIARTIYVTYEDSATKLEAEASSTATGNNPYTRANRTKDVVYAAPGPMSSADAAALAAKIAAVTGPRLPSQGTLTVPIGLEVWSRRYGSVPALMIRPGQNISLIDLPGDTGPTTPVRDGKRVFRIVSVEVDVDAGNVRLSLEGQGRAVDAILARLASVTRALTAAG